METPYAGYEGAPVEPSLEETRQRFNEAFNRQDVRAFAELFAEDASLIDPGGVYACGRDAIARVFGDNVRTFLAGTTTRFAIRSVRKLPGDYALLDLDQDIENFRMPDGTRGTQRLHVVILAHREQDGWRWLDARPHSYLPKPPALH